jgi:hypothetical protein
MKTAKELEKITLRANRLNIVKDPTKVDAILLKMAKNGFSNYTVDVDLAIEQELVKSLRDRGFTVYIADYEGYSSIEVCW